MKKIVTLMWYSKDMCHYMFKAEFVTLVSLKVPSGGLHIREEGGGFGLITLCTDRRTSL